MMSIPKKVMLLVSCIAICWVASSCGQLRYGRIITKEVVSEADTLTYRGTRFSCIPDSLLLEMAGTIDSAQRAFDYIVNPIVVRRSKCIGLFKMVAGRSVSFVSVNKVLVFKDKVYVWHKGQPEENQRKLNEFVNLYSRYFSEQELTLLRDEFNKGVNHIGRGL